MTDPVPAALRGADGDCHAVAITKVAIAALLGTSTVSPATISRRAHELDDADADPRGVSTYTLRNNPGCRALLNEFRTHRAVPPERREERIPQHIRDMDKAALIEALGRARAEGGRADRALDQLATTLATFGRTVDRSRLDASLAKRKSLTANRTPGTVPPELLQRAADDAARSVRLTGAALKHLGKDARPTHGDVLRAARTIDAEGRGLHDAIFETNAECAALVAKANGLPAKPACEIPPDKALARLDNYQLGLAVWTERKHVKLLLPLVAKAADLAIDLELPALLETMRSQERRFLKEEAELARALADDGAG